MAQNSPRMSMITPSTTQQRENACKRLWDEGTKAVEPPVTMRKAPMKIAPWCREGILLRDSNTGWGYGLGCDQMDSVTHTQAATQYAPHVLCHWADNKRLQSHRRLLMTRKKTSLLGSHNFHRQKRWKTADQEVQMFKILTLEIPSLVQKVLKLIFFWKWVKRIEANWGLWCASGHCGVAVFIIKADGREDDRAH